MKLAAASTLVAMARLLPVALLLPPLSWWRMPVWLRLAIGGVLTLAAAPAVSASLPKPQLGIDLAVHELATGLALALIVSLPFWALQIAGVFAGRAGLGGNGEGPLPTATFLLGMAVVVAVHGHTWIIAGLLRSFTPWPPGAPVPQADILRAAGEMLGAALLIALPMLAICGVAHLAMALAERLFIVPSGLPVEPVAVVIGLGAMVPLLVAVALQEVNAVVGFLAAGQ